jgi:FkbM family methyltransferase
MRNGWKLDALRFIGHQHYIKRGRDRLLRTFHHPDTSPSVPFEVPFFGMRYAGNLNDFIDWCVFFYGAFARNELDLLRDVAVALKKQNPNRPLNFYDVGANVGQHTLFMSQHADQVFAFEPFAAVRSKLLEKIALNNRANVTTYPVGLGDVSTELDFFVPSGAGNGLGSFLVAPETDCKIEKLPVWKGDEFLKSNGLPKIDIVKIDVEGFEVRVISGLRERLCKDRPVILMEVGPTTRAEMVSETAFRQCLYPEAQIFGVGAVNISSTYRLNPFHFESSREILVVPSENASLLEVVSPK